MSPSWDQECLIGNNLALLNSDTDDDIATPLYLYETMEPNIHPRTDPQAKANALDNKDASIGFLGHANLPDLPTDVLALVLSHLELLEIAAVSLVSRATYQACRDSVVWKVLLEFRWNVGQGRVSPALLEEDENSSPTTRSMDYYRAYQNAHRNPHTLWIRHRNIVYPGDGLTPGRCCIDSSSCQKHASEADRPRRQGSNNRSKIRLCPHCRARQEAHESHHDEKMDTIETPAQAMAAATRRMHQKFQSSTMWPSVAAASVLVDASKSETDAQALMKQQRRMQQKAFAQAATFHRKLRTTQFESCQLSFLTDLLFFNLTDPATSEGQWELDQLLREALSTTSQTTNIPNQRHRRPHHHLTSPLHETSNHSWHVVQLTNSDFFRPIAFQVYIARPDCFTCYPSAGYLEPGESVSCVIGVRPLGSALAYAFEGLNVAREGLEPAWADLYTAQAHLPLAPLSFRYQFVATVPQRWVSPAHDGDIDNDPAAYRRQANSLYPSDPYATPTERTLDHHGCKSWEAHKVRTVALSAHVHAHYSFQDFLYATGFRSSRFVSITRTNFVAPQLQERFPEIFNRLANSDGSQRRSWKATSSDLLDTFSTLVSKNTERPCSLCNRPWGLRAEELYYALVLSKLTSSSYQFRRDMQLKNLQRCLRVLATNTAKNCLNVRLSKLFVSLFTILQAYKASPWLSLKHKKVLIIWEITLDIFCRQIPVGGANWVPWRFAGIYRHALCTESVHSGPNLLDGANNFEKSEIKEEPDYLDAFRHLAHSPGRYCLGPQEDPNHLDEAIVINSSKYGRRQKGMITDMFMDDPVSTFQAGICMINDPRSLLVHGIFDRIPYPGSIVRRPHWMPLGLYIERIEYDDHATNLNVSAGAHLLSSKERTAYFRLQNGMDINSMVGVDPSLRQIAAVSILSHLSMQNYLHNIPPPGVGRFPLSKRASVGQRATTEGAALEIEPLLFHANQQHLEGSSTTVNTTTGQQQALPHATFAVPRRNLPRPPNPRGPRLVQLLWILAAQMGLAVVDTSGDSSVYVDRKILIATQWISISLMIVPLFLTLFSRFLQLIPTQPVDYNLESLPFHVTNKMRFLTEYECGQLAFGLILAWLVLGRWVERYTSRDFLRMSMSPGSITSTQLHRHRWKVFSDWLGLTLSKWWDAICPVFLQSRAFSPEWNRRSRSGMLQHLSYWRSRNLAEQRSYAHASQRAALFGLQQSGLEDFGKVSPSGKIAWGIGVTLVSFASSSPHFWLNLVTIFSCSLSLGMTVSLYAMEHGRVAVTVASGTTSATSSLSQIPVLTVVMLGFLVGQLVGSSGGTLFLAEFVVTAVSLLLGGAGTVSASAMESWICFLCLASTAFGGYLLGRVALMDNIRNKQSGFSSMLLSKAILLLVVFWVLILFVARWDVPVSLVIVRPRLRTDDNVAVSRAQIAKHLQ
jgi:hypothetical protein